jgi:tetratricopeptide (TPR) repeat protein
MLSWRFRSGAWFGLVVTLSLLARGNTAEPTEFPPAARDRFNQGDELRKKQQYQDAITAFEEAIKLGMANYPRVYLYRADAFRGLGSHDAAIVQYTEFIDKFGIEESCRH